MKRLMTGIFCSLMVSVCLPASAQPQAPGAHHMTITGVVPGPPLWQVRHGDNTLWIFGLLDPLPKNLDWDSNRVERLIAQAGGVIQMPEMKPSENLGLIKGFTLYRYYRRMRTNMPGDSLQEVLPSELYARFLQAKGQYGPRGTDVLELRPLFAAREISSAARDSIDMEYPRSIARKIERAIKRSDAEIYRAGAEFSTPIRELLLEIDTIPLYTEIECLAGTLENIETDIGEMRERAYSWSYGYMGELYTQSILEPSQNCVEALLAGEGIGGIINRIRQLWLQDAETVLATHETGFAMVPMYMLLNDDNFIDALEARGYEVIEP